MTKVGVWLKLVYWEQRLWLAVELLVPKDSFVKAMSATRAVDPCALTYVLLTDMVNAVDEPARPAFVSQLRQFVLPDDASLQFDLSWLGGPATWYDTGRQFRSIRDPHQFAVDNDGETPSPAPPSGQVFGAQYNEHLRQVLAQTEPEPPDYETIAASLSFGRDVVVRPRVVNLTEPPEVAAAGMSTVMALAPGPLPSTSTQSLNGLMIALPSSYDPTQHLPSTIKCRILDGSSNVVFCDLSFDMSHAPPLDIAVAAQHVQHASYPVFPYEQVAWSHHLNGDEIANPHREVVVHRSWIDYSPVGSSGHHYYFRTTSLADLRSLDVNQHTVCLGQVPDIPDTVAFTLTLATVLEGSLTPLSGLSKDSSLWRFVVSAASWDALQARSLVPSADIPVLQVFAQHADGHFVPIAAVGFGRLALLNLTAPSEWVFLLSLDGSHDPTSADWINHLLFFSHLYGGEIEGIGQRGFGFEMFGAGVWNAARVVCADATMAEATVQVARTSDVTFVPTNSTDVVDVSLSTVAPQPLADFSGTPLDNDYYRSLYRDSRGFAGLEVIFSTQANHLQVNRVYPTEEDCQQADRRTRRYRARFAANWANGSLHPELAAARVRIALVGSTFTLTGVLRDVYGRSRPLGLRDYGPSMLTLPWRVGCFPVALSSLVVRDETHVYPGIALPGNLQFLLTTSIDPYPHNQVRIFKVRIFFNEGLLHDLMDEERVARVWQSLADAALAERIVATFIELDLDNTSASSGFLTPSSGGTIEPLSIDITNPVREIALRLIESGSAGTGTVEFSLPVSFIVRQSGSSSYFACAVQVQREVRLLATSDLYVGDDSEPVLILHDGETIRRINDRELDGAFAAYQRSVAASFAPLAIGESTDDDGLSWENRQLAPCSGLKFPPRSLWPIPLPPDAIDSTRLIGFLCAPRLLKKDASVQRMFENLVQVIDILRRGHLGAFGLRAEAVELLAYMDGAVLSRGLPLGPQGYEDTSTGGAWTKLLGNLARRFDVLHGDLGAVCAEASQALPWAIPHHTNPDDVRLGDVETGFSMPIGHVIREALVTHWRNDASSAWNKTALWVSVLSTSDGTDPNQAVRHMREVTTTLANSDAGFPVTASTPLGGTKPSMTAAVLDRRKFRESLRVVRAVAFPIQRGTAASASLRVHHFRVPTGDWFEKDPVCDLILPSTEELADPVIEASGIESDPMQDVSSFLGAINALMQAGAGLRKSDLINGEIRGAPTGDATDDVLQPIGVSSADLAEADVLVTYRAILVSVQGDAQLEQPFSRDRFLICRTSGARAAGLAKWTTVGNRWDALADVDPLSVESYVAQTLVAYGTSPIGMQTAANDLTNTINALSPLLSTVDSPPVSESSVLAKIVLEKAGNGLVPRIEFTSAAVDSGIPSHMYVIVLRNPSDARLDTDQLRLFVAVGFGMTSASNLGFTHDRDALWIEPGRQFIAPAFSQTKQVDLPGLVRPRAFTREVHPTKAAEVRITDLPWVVFDTALRGSGDQELVKLADILNLQQVAAGNETRYRHLVLRLSLEAAVPTRLATVDPALGISLQPVVWEASHRTRWAYGMTYKAGSELGTPLTFPDAGLQMRLTGQLTILSSNVERPILVVKGLRIDLVT